MKDRFGMGFWLTLAVAAFAGLLGPAVATAGWAPIATTAGFSGDRPNDLTSLDTPDGGKFLYWHRDVGGFDTVQAMTMAPDGTPGSIMNVSGGLSDYGRDLEAVVAEDGKATFAWIGPGAPTETVKSVVVPSAGVPGAVTEVVAPGAPGHDIDHLSIAVTPDGTVGYTWARFNVSIHQVEAVTVPDGGAVGTMRVYTDAPYDIADPGIAAMPSDQFQLAWIPFNQGTGFWNIAATNIQNDGTPLDAQPTFVFPTTAPVTDLVDGVCQQLRDPNTNEPLKVDSGATGSPQDLQFGSNAEGLVYFAWTRDTVVGDKACNGTISNIVGQQRAVEIYGSLSALTRVSPLNVDIGPLEMQITRDRRNTLTWRADDNGNYSTQLYRLADGALWTITAGSVFADPTVTMAASGAIGLGWTLEGALPDDAVAKLAFISRIGILSYPVLPGLAGLKSSSEPLADPGTGGLASVLFYGLDAGDNGSFYTSGFSDPGISISPPSLSFGGTFQNTRSAVRRVFVSNPGSTPNQVTSIALGGPDAAIFQILNPATCVTELAPGAACELRLAFSPTDSGNHQATLDVESEAGDVSTSLSGNGVARTRVTMTIKPHRHAVRPGGKTSFATVVKNKGGIAAEGIKVCVNGSKRAIVPGKSCKRINSLAAGSSRSLGFSFRVKRGAKSDREHLLMFKLKSANAKSHRGAAILKVKPARS